MHHDGREATRLKSQNTVGPITLYCGGNDMAERNNTTGSPTSHTLIQTLAYRPRIIKTWLQVSHSKYYLALERERSHISSLSNINNLSFIWDWITFREKKNIVCEDISEDVN